MTDARRQIRNGERLDECHPAFRAALRRVLRLVEADGYRPRIQDAYRDPAVQLAAFEAGRSQLRYGLHNVTSAAGRPEALAADVLDDDAPLAPARRYLLRLAIAADQCGLETGIGWGLPTALRRHLDLAIAHREVEATVKLGWDPCHVQIRGVRLRDVIAGYRPTEVRV